MLRTTLSLGALPLVEGEGCEALSSISKSHDHMWYMTPDPPKPQPHVPNKWLPEGMQRPWEIFDWNAEQLDDEHLCLTREPRHGRHACVALRGSARGLTVARGPVAPRPRSEPNAPRRAKLAGQMTPKRFLNVCIACCLTPIYVHVYVETCTVSARQ